MSNIFQKKLFLILTNINMLIYLFFKLSTISDFFVTPTHRLTILHPPLCIKKCLAKFVHTTMLTLSLLGYLKTRICDPPPSKSHVLCPNMTNDVSLESSCALLLESAKKFANLQKLNFLSQNPFI